MKKISVLYLGTCTNVCIFFFVKANLKNGESEF